jgi:hypothetical protein
MASKPKAPTSQKELAKQLVFNPHIWWDPVPPWVTDQSLVKELTTISLEHQKQMLDIHAKTIDRAISAIKGSR